MHIEMYCMLQFVAFMGLTYTSGAISCSCPCDRAIGTSTEESDIDVGVNVGSSDMNVRNKFGQKKTSRYNRPL